MQPTRITKERMQISKQTTKMLASRSMKAGKQNARVPATKEA